jgi:hypothetical protein
MSSTTDAMLDRDGQPIREGAHVTARVRGRGKYPTRTVTGTVKGVRPRWGRRGIVWIDPDDRAQGCDTDGRVSCVPDHVTVGEGDA